MADNATSHRVRRWHIEAEFPNGHLLMSAVDARSELEAQRKALERWAPNIRVHELEGAGDDRRDT